MLVQPPALLADWASAPWEDLPSAEEKAPPEARLMGRDQQIGARGEPHQSGPILSASLPSLPLPPHPLPLGAHDLAPLQPCKQSHTSVQARKMVPKNV